MFNNKENSGYFWVKTFIKDHKKMWEKLTVTSFKDILMIGFTCVEHTVQCILHIAH